MNILLNGTCKQNGTTSLLWDIILEVVLLSMFTEIFDTCSQMALRNIALFTPSVNHPGCFQLQRNNNPQYKLALRKRYLSSHTNQNPSWKVQYALFCSTSFFSKDTGWESTNKLHVDSLENNGPEMLGFHSGAGDRGYLSKFWLRNGGVRDPSSHHKGEQSTLFSGPPLPGHHSASSPCQSNKWIISFKISSVKQMAWASSIV